MAGKSKHVLCQRCLRRVTRTKGHLARRPDQLQPNGCCRRCNEGMTRASRSQVATMGLYEPDPSQAKPSEASLHHDVLRDDPKPSLPAFGMKSSIEAKISHVLCHVDSRDKACHNIAKTHDEDNLTRLAAVASRIVTSSTTL